MKITFVIGRANLSGGSRVIATYADLLTRRGHEVRVVSQPNSKHTLFDHIRSLSRTGRLARQTTTKHHFARPGLDFQIIDSIRPIIDDDLPDADVVIATFWVTAYWVAALAPQKGRKFYFVQGHEVHDHLPWQISRGSYYLPLKKITVSNWLANTMAEEYDDRDVALVPNGVDTTLFHAQPRTRQSVPTIGMMYSPTHLKGTDTVLKAVEKARQRMPNLRLVAFSTTDPASHLPLPQNTRYVRTPDQTEIRDIYGTCDAWLFGSRHEGFGLPLLEAMACRTPVIATRAGAAPDLIQDGVNGHIINVGDADSMADKILSTLTLSPTDWRAMSNAAHTTAQANTWDSCADRFERALTPNQSVHHRPVDGQS